jgi:hypothetical protein
VNYPVPGPLSIWSDADPIDPGPVSVTNPEPDPFPVPTGILAKDAITAATAATAKRYTAPAIVNTQRVMGLLQSVPANRSIITNLPANQLMSEVLPATTAGLLPAAGGTPPNPPLIVDAWGNPIIFVPAGGLYGMTVGEILRLRAPTSATSFNGPITSNDKRPFWASAGADGDFAKGDDNIYSFED